MRSLTLPVVLMLFLTGCIFRQPPLPAAPKAAKVAVVLGAGATKGFAHVGVLKILETNRIPVHMIVGTSAGSVIGSLYAYGFNAFQLQKIALEVEQGEIVDLGIPDNGFIKGEKLADFINKYLRNTPMEKLRIPFYAVATDIQIGQEIVFATGNTGTAVRASSSIPGVFMPVRIKERLYVDGGLVSPVAVDAARRHGADLIIAVDVNSAVDDFTPTGSIDTILKSIGIMYSKIAQAQLARADVVIRPKVGHIGSSDFSKRHEAVLEGEKAAVEAMPQINRLIGQLRQEGRL